MLKICTCRNIFLEFCRESLANFMLVKYALPNSNYFMNKMESQDICQYTSSIGLRSWVTGNKPCRNLGIRVPNRVYFLSDLECLIYIVRYLGKRSEVQTDITLYSISNMCPVGCILSCIVVVKYSACGFTSVLKSV